MKPKAQVFEITSPTKKISLNCHLNKFSQFNYYITTEGGRLQKLQKLVNKFYKYRPKEMNS